MKKALIFIISVIFCGLILYSHKVTAINWSEIFGIRNDIRFYDPNNQENCVISVSSFGDLKLTEQGKKWLESSNLQQKIDQEIVINGKTRKQLYIEAAKADGYPEQIWMLLSVVDLNERGFGTTKTILNGRDNFGTSAKNATDGVASGNDYQSDLIVGINHLSAKANAIGFDLKDTSQWTVDNIGKLFLYWSRGNLYNNVNLTWQNSGYVNNFSENYAYNGRLDDPRYCTEADRMTQKTGKTYGCNYKHEKTGVIHIFNYLNNNFSIDSSSGSSSSNNCSSIAGLSGRLGEVFNKYAWPEYHPKGTTEAMNPKNPNYKAEVIASGYAGGNSGQDCNAWTRFAMIKSGIDVNFPVGSTVVAGNHLRNPSSGWTQITTGVPDTATLQSGDIAWCTGHIYFYVGNGIISSASYSGSSGNIQNGRYPMRGHMNECGSKTLYWFRKVR